MQKIKIGHRANFRAKNKCFRQILFPVRAILRSINFRYADFNTDSADACILVMACVDLRKLMQSSDQVNNIAPNYSPEVETEKPFTRKRKENDLDGKVLCLF